MGFNLGSAINFSVKSHFLLRHLHAGCFTDGTTISLTSCCATFMLAVSLMALPSVSLPAATFRWLFTDGTPFRLVPSSSDMQSIIVGLVISSPKRSGAVRRA